MNSNLLTLKEEYEQVIKQFPDWSAKQFADYFGVSISGFYSAMYRYGLKLSESNKRHFGPRLKDFILGKPKAELIDFAKEHTVNEIAEYTGKNSKYVWKVLTEKKIEYKKTFVKNAVTRKVNHYGDEKDMILELIKLDKFTDASIARVFGYSKSVIRNMRVNRES